MHGEARLAAALERLSLTHIDRAVTRFINDRYQRTALEATGALRIGGRYNPPGTPALYTSLRRSTALSEITWAFDDEDPIEPMLMLSVTVRSENIADLTNTANLRACGTTKQELNALIVDLRSGDAPSQILGRVAHGTARIDGLLVWSRVARGEKNLVLFPDRLGMEYDLHDPEGSLPALHPAIRAAMDILMGAGG